MGLLDLNESEGGDTPRLGIKNECVPVGEVASDSDTGLLSMLRIVVSQVTELNSQFSEMGNLRGSLARVSAEARRYTGRIPFLHCMTYHIALISMKSTLLMDYGGALAIYLHNSFSGSTLCNTSLTFLHIESLFI